MFINQNWPFYLYTSIIHFNHILLLQIRLKKIGKNISLLCEFFFFNNEPMNPRKNLIIVSLSHYLIEQIKSGIHLWYPIGLEYGIS